MTPPRPMSPDGRESPMFWVQAASWDFEPRPIDTEDIR
jgi:hypothetical protein